MKKFTAAFLLMVMMAVILPFAATSANAQRQRYVRKKPNVYQRHRNLFNIGIGTAAGAILGGLVGGRRGALIGAGAGAGGSALYTYKLNPKRR